MGGGGQWGYGGDGSAQGHHSGERRHWHRAWGGEIDMMHGGEGDDHRLDSSVDDNCGQI